MSEASKTIPTIGENATTEQPSPMQKILHEEATWIGVAFVLTLVLIIKYLMPMINKGLDARADKIRDQLEQAKRLRAEAQELLATYQRQQESSLKQAEEILATAKRDAADLRARAAEELKQNLERRTQQAKERIARAESEAVAQIRNEIIESATRMAHEMIAARMSGQSDDPSVARAVAAIERQIH